MYGKNLIQIAAVGAALIGTSASQAREHLTPDQELAKILKDRVAGKPVNCIYLRDIRSTTIIDKTAIVYDTGSVIYVNRPAYPQSLDSDDVMVTKTWSGQLCRLDIVELRERSGMWMHGSVGLETFTPYTKAPRVPSPLMAPTGTPTATPTVTETVPPR
jgi:hypothetical protein